MPGGILFWDPGTHASLLWQTLTEVIRLSGCAWPPGWFIHKFTAITTMALPKGGHSHRSRTGRRYTTTVSWLDGGWAHRVEPPPEAASPSSCAGVVLGQIPSIGSLRDFSQH